MEDETSLLLQNVERVLHFSVSMTMIAHIRNVPPSEALRINRKYEALQRLVGKGVRTFLDSVRKRLHKASTSERDETETLLYSAREADVFIDLLTTQSESNESLSSTYSDTIRSRIVSSRRSSEKLIIL